MSEDGVTVVGAGGIGSAVGYALMERGAKVQFVEVNREKIAWGGRHGLDVIPFDEWNPEPELPILVCVKCYDNAAVLAKLPEIAKLIPIENGFDAELDSRNHSIEGIASFVAHCPSDRIEPQITRRGDLHFGYRNSNRDEELLQWLRQAFAPLLYKNSRTKFVPNILPIKYTKLMYNSAISPLAAAAGIDNGALLSHPVARRLFFSLLQENYRILENAGIELGKVGPFHPRTVAKILRRKWLARAMAKFFEPSLRGTYCSMAGEIEKGRTEIDNYTGHLLKLAEGKTDAPLNRAVYELVKRMERNRETPRMEMLDFV